jgi:hypothetical protein
VRSHRSPADRRPLITDAMLVAACSYVALATSLSSELVLCAALLGISEKTLGQPLPQVRVALVCLTSSTHVCAGALHYVHSSLSCLWHQKIYTCTSAGSATSTEPRVCGAA